MQAPVAHRLDAHDIIEVIVLVILVAVTVVIVTALLPTYNNSFTNYTTNSTTGLRTVVATLGRLMLDVAIILVIVIGLLAVAMKYGRNRVPSWLWYTLSAGFAMIADAVSQMDIDSLTLLVS
jgi:uncharacterized membrane protein